MTAPGSRARAVTGLGLGSLVVSLFFCAAIAIMGAILAGGGNPLGWVLLVFGVVLTAMMAHAVRLWLRLTPAVTFTLGPGRAPGGGARPGAETAPGGGQSRRSGDATSRPAPSCGVTRVFLPGGSDTG